MQVRTFLLEKAQHRHRLGYLLNLVQNTSSGEEPAGTRHSSIIAWISSDSVSPRRNKAACEGFSRFSSA